MGVYSENMFAKITVTVMNLTVNQVLSYTIRNDPRNRSRLILIDLVRSGLNRISCS